MQTILTINGGSSSIRFAWFSSQAPYARLLSGKLDRIGQPGTALVVTGPGRRPGRPHRLVATGHRTAVKFLLDWLEREPLFESTAAIGHRLVQGLAHSAPERITARLVTELSGIARYDPDHLPSELELVEAFRRRHPRLPQVACFDTAFHRTMPAVARVLPIPRAYAGPGVERYGFHGLSYAFLTEELRRLDARTAQQRLILAHLGNGASLAAVHRGQSQDTSMGFTPASGLVMGTRTGDVDPGLEYYLSRTKGLSAAAFQHMANHQSGLLGVSGTTSNMQDLLGRVGRDPRAALAVDLFCYRAKQGIGAFAAVLGGVDTLVFSGGIGENAPAVRARICEGLGFLGITLDPRRNERSAAIISRRASRTTVRVIPTDEELMIARSVAQLGLAGSPRLRPARRRAPPSSGRAVPRPRPFLNPL